MGELAGHEPEDWPMEDAEFPCPRAGDGRGVRWGVETARQVLRRTLAGESMRAIGRDPSMPAPHTVGRWAREKPRFAQALEAARVAAGHGRPGGRSTYCEATAMAIFERVCQGEAVTAVCRDPAMPVVATVYKWRAERPEFARALSAAMMLRAEHLYEEGWEIAQAVTPQTAYATDVKLRHLRWHVGKLAPKKYGNLKAAEPGAGREGPQRVLHTYLKKYVLPTAEQRAAGECGRWSEEPAQHLSSMVPVSEPGPLAGQRLPPPDVIREPASCQGPNPTRMPNGGAVEAEVEEMAEDAAAEDFWTAPDWTEGPGSEGS